MRGCFLRLAKSLDCLIAKLVAAGFKVGVTVFSNTTKSGAFVQDVMEKFHMEGTNICAGLLATEAYLSEDTLILLVSDGEDTSHYGGSADIPAILLKFPQLKYRTGLVVLGVGSNPPWLNLFNPIETRYGSKTIESQSVGSFVEWGHTREYELVLEQAKATVTRRPIRFPCDSDYVDIEPVMKALWELITKGDELGKEDEVVDLQTMALALARLSAKVRKQFAHALCQRGDANAAAKLGRSELVRLEAVFAKLAHTGVTYDNLPPRLVYGRSNPDACSLRDEIDAMRQLFKGFEETASSDKLALGLSDAGLGSIITGKGPSASASKALATYAKPALVTEKNGDFAKFCNCTATSLKSFVMEHPFATFQGVVILRSPDAVLAPFTTVVTEIGPPLDKAAYKSFFDGGATFNAIVPLKHHPRYSSMWAREVFAYSLSGAEARIPLASHALLAALLVKHASKGVIPDLRAIYESFQHTSKWEEYIDKFKASPVTTLEPCYPMPQFVLGAYVTGTPGLEDMAVKELYRRWKGPLVTGPTAAQIWDAVDPSLFSESWTQGEALAKVKSALKCLDVDFEMTLLPGVCNFGVTLEVLRTVFGGPTPDYPKLCAEVYPNIRQDAIKRAVDALSGVEEVVGRLYAQTFADSHFLVLPGGTHPNRDGMSTVECRGLGCHYFGKAIGQPKTNAKGEPVLSLEVSQHIAGDKFIPGFHSTVSRNKTRGVDAIVAMVESGHVLIKDKRVTEKHRDALAATLDIKSEVEKLLKALEQPLLKPLLPA